jgi:hypothetical protein
MEEQTLFIVGDKTNADSRPLPWARWILINLNKEFSVDFLFFSVSQKTKGNSFVRREISIVGKR